MKIYDYGGEFIIQVFEFSCVLENVGEMWIVSGSLRVFLSLPLYVIPLHCAYQSAQSFTSELSFFCSCYLNVHWK